MPRLGQPRELDYRPTRSGRIRPRLHLRLPARAERLRLEGDKRTVLFARAAVAALATTTILTTRISELCDHTPNYLGNGRWPEKAHQHRLSVETVMARWASGLNYALDLGDEAHRLSRTLS